MTKLHPYINKTAKLLIDCINRIDCLNGQNNLRWFDRCFAHILYSDGSQGFPKIRFGLFISLLPLV